MQHIHAAGAERSLETGEAFERNGKDGSEGVLCMVKFPYIVNLTEGFPFLGLNEKCLCSEITIFLYEWTDG